MSFSQTIKTLGFLLLIESQLIPALSANILSTPCYSSYHVEQQIKLSIQLDSSSEQKNIIVDMSVHLKKVNTPKEVLTRILNSTNNVLKNEALKVSSYVMLIKPNFSKLNGISSNFKDRYAHPFLAHVKDNTGKLIDFQSTQSDKSILNEYISYFDFFQYSKLPGSYIYQNGNGKYNAEISTLASSNGKNPIEKKNVGYLSFDNKLLLKNSLMKITSSIEPLSCFYKNAEIKESFTNNISKGAFVNGKAVANISLDHSLSLPKDHFFYTLTSQLSSWPNAKNKIEIDSKMAFEKTPSLLKQLLPLVDSKPEFLNVMNSNKELWPFIAEYLTFNQSDSNLINKVIWALDRIDNTQSINALLRIAISPISEKQVNHAIQALASTSASIDMISFDLLKNHIESYRFNPSASSNELLLVRALGLFAKRRDNRSPLQSNEVKEFLYSQMEGGSKKFKIALLDSVGSLGNTIDSQGLELLMDSLDDHSSDINNAATKALIKIPYQEEYTSLYVSKLNSDISSTTKTHLIQLLGNTKKTDHQVKDELLTIIDKTNNSSHNRSSLQSLKKISYSFKKDEINILRSRLRKEKDKTNQKL